MTNKHHEFVQKLQYHSSITLGDVPVGTRLRDFYVGKIRVIILRGPASFCAYVGILKSHPFYTVTWSERDSIDVHGGFTFGRFTFGKTYLGDRNRLPRGRRWFGWDYAHSCDAHIYSVPGWPAKVWTLGEVEAEARNVAEQINKKYG